MRTRSSLYLVPSVPVRVVTALLAVTVLGCSARTAQSPVAVGQSRGGGPVCPLTGMPAPRGVDPNRPAVAVKVENSPEARPQTGLDAADLVYEEPVEGGLTWLLAVFQCSDASLVGPVRNAHPSDTAILAGNSPAVFAHAGAAAPLPGALDAVKNLREVDGLRNSDAFQRLDGRAVPHNLYVSMPKLRALAGRGGPPRPWAAFHGPGGPIPSPSPSASGTPGRPVTGTSAQFTLGPASVRWTWDKDAGAYVRRQGTAPFTDPEGRPLHVANVVFLWVKVTETDTRDAAGGRTPVLTVTGEGDALVLDGGVERSGRWIRPSLTDPPALVDRKGRPMALQPGHSWIHLLPTDTPVFVR